ncbi:hypothetical protein WICPIJ_005596 [Wickerhamomyces pijperi]|uniref:Uncharacterized protein n=1 Tax=Wickerhamomyces pijperi TaxID=599730 RepID=A0A9P8Q5V4_WICPI|nr:hypothetical protein WICPIJ_005596 [Wickerhamomyces pijperi]
MLLRSPTSSISLNKVEARMFCPVFMEIIGVLKLTNKLHALAKSSVCLLPVWKTSVTASKKEYSFFLDLDSKARSVSVFDSSREQSTTWSNNKCCKTTPITTIDTVPDQKQPTTILSVAVVNCTEDENSQQTTKTTGDGFKSSKEVKFGRKTQHDHRDNSGRQQVGNEVDL